ncbi:hypothetical protein HY772_07055 [Candidatus Woesearchaeota archaeon]|nr:hypothetical protein [Candidatus Woesearchaeota archaeon]
MRDDEPKGMPLDFNTLGTKLLWARGSPAETFLVIRRGGVEVRIGNDLDSKLLLRFSEGEIIGDTPILLLSNQPVATPTRTADVLLSSKDTLVDIFYPDDFKKYEVLAYNHIVSLFLQNTTNLYRLLESNKYSTNIDEQDYVNDKIQGALHTSDGLIEKVLKQEKFDFNRIFHLFRLLRRERDEIRDTLYLPFTQLEGNQKLWGAKQQALQILLVKMERNPTQTTRLMKKITTQLQYNLGLVDTNSNGAKIIQLNEWKKK